MAIYIVLLGVMILLFGIYIYFWVKRLMRYYGADPAKKRTRILRWVLTAVLTVAAGFFMTMPGLILLHVMLISGVLEFIAFLLDRFSGIKKSERAGKLIGAVCRSGVTAVVISCLILGYGYYNMNRVVETAYEIKTEKNIRPEGYRIALITDTHYGSVQNTDRLKEQIDKISEQEPDLVLLGGDITEEGTSYQELQEVFSLLAGIKNQYGIYYVYGNHDRQPYTANRSYTDEQLAQVIEKNGIHILGDSYEVINSDILLAGRDDAAWGNTRSRKSIQEILEGANRNLFTIMLDHQPIEVAENAREGVDLQLSGHTHAGQIWPIGLLTELTGNYNYGHYRKDGLDLIVSSGEAGWAYRVRTGEHCEYVIIDIKNNRK